MEKHRISVKNIVAWLMDQLTHPATIFRRKSWGVFSEYAHVRRSDRLPKKSSATKAEAQRVADFMARKYGGSYSIYKCVYCDGWHIAKDAERAATEPKGEPRQEYQEKAITADFNLDGILASGIPDIASVYGGVRGRTLSSPAQGFAWPIVRECGVRTIIDLREDGIYTHMQRQCDKSGMKYFYYPVDTKAKNVKKMVAVFPKFCSLIDEGRFYIACAMGLHRTDIALCAYWMYYGADKGIAPPVLRGYRKSDGHITEKIMRVLNAMYKEFTERDGKEPLPPHVFNERKKVIERQNAIN